MNLRALEKSNPSHTLYVHIILDPQDDDFVAQSAMWSDTHKEICYAWDLLVKPMPLEQIIKEQELTRKTRVDNGRVYESKYYSYREATPDELKRVREE